MDVIHGLENSMNATDNIEIYVFSYALWDVETCNDISVIKVWWMHNELHHTLIMNQYQQSTYGCIVGLSFK